MKRNLALHLPIKITFTHKDDLMIQYQIIEFYQEFFFGFTREKFDYTGKTSGWFYQVNPASNWRPPETPRTSQHYCIERFKENFNWVPIMPRDASLFFQSGQRVISGY